MLLIVIGKGRNNLINLPAIIVEMDETNEPDEYWECLGGKGEYASGAELESSVNERPPRLFQMSNASGYFNLEEIYNFNQDVSCSPILCQPC